jgi:copper chaperone
MCASEADTGTSQSRQAEQVGRNYSVTGMTCQPCATKVTDAVEQVDGVTGVSVDLTNGRLTVAGTAPDTAIEGAVTGAGYQISAL